jgi:multicomponent Na+:H+ antiporter subunit F
MFFKGLGGMDLVLGFGSLIASLFLLVALAFALARIIKGPTAFDRVLALDLVGGLCLSVIVMFAIYFKQEALLDAAFAIAIVSFLATVAFARYLGGGEEK